MVAGVEHLIKQVEREFLKRIDDQYNDMPVTFGHDLDTGRYFWSVSQLDEETDTFVESKFNCEYREQENMIHLNEALIHLKSL